MPSYCVFADLQSRLTVAGMEWAANRDGGDTLTSDEVDQYVTPAIMRADSEIDAAIQLYYETSAARGNAWLKFLAVDLASVEAITNGGRQAPENYVADCKRAREELRRVSIGQLRIPGLARRIPQQYASLPTENITIVNMVCDD